MEGYKSVHLLHTLHYYISLSSPSSVLSLHSRHCNQIQWRGNASLHAGAHTQPLSFRGLADKAMKQSASPIRESGLVWLGLAALVSSRLNPPAHSAPFISFHYFHPTIPADNTDVAFIMLLCHFCFTGWQTRWKLRDNKCVHYQRRWTGLRSWSTYKLRVQYHSLPFETVLRKNRTSIVPKHKYDTRYWCCHEVVWHCHTSKEYYNK